MDSEFFRKTQLDENGCLLWRGKLNSKGRPIWKNRSLYASSIASRISYQLAHGLGSIPPGLCVLHTCHNRLCVNPNHLILGTQLENLNQMYSLNRGPSPSQRSRKGERNGSSKFSPEIVLKVRKSSGTYRELSRLYSMSVSSVRRIKLGLSWTHLEVLS